MSYWYKKTDVKDYVVSLSAEYNISCPDAEDVFDAEEQAIDTIETELDKRGCEELDTYVIDAMPSIVGRLVKVKVNMVVPVVASGYEEAQGIAESFIDDMNLPGNIAYIGVGTWDSALADERTFLLRCKGA